MSYRADTPGASGQQDGHVVSTRLHWGEISLYVVRVYYRSPRFQFKINIHYYTTERDWVALLDGPAERQLFMQVKSFTQTSTCGSLTVVAPLPTTACPEEVLNLILH